MAGRDVEVERLCPGVLECAHQRLRLGFLSLPTDCFVSLLLASSWWQLCRLHPRVAAGGARATVQQRARRADQRGRATDSALAVPQAGHGDGGVPSPEPAVCTPPHSCWQTSQCSSIVRRRCCQNRCRCHNCRHCRHCHRCCYCCYYSAAATALLPILLPGGSIVKHNLMHLWTIMITVLPRGLLGRRAYDDVGRSVGLSVCRLVGGGGHTATRPKRPQSLKPELSLDAELAVAVDALTTEQRSRI